MQTSPEFRAGVQAMHDLLRAVIRERMATPGLTGEQRLEIAGWSGTIAACATDAMHPLRSPTAPPAGAEP